MASPLDSVAQSALDSVQVAEGTRLLTATLDCVPLETRFCVKFSSLATSTS
jgi:hypothetical protein